MADLPLWRDLPFSLLAPEKETAWEWALVLTSRDLPVRVRTQDDDFGVHYCIQVPPEFLDTAVRELSAYENENRAEPEAPPLPTPYENTLLTILILVCVFLFHIITQNRWRFLNFDASLHPLDWQGLGSTLCWDCLFNNEWWRYITALTLHADAAHLFSNLFIGGVLLVPLCRELGSGLGWFLVLAAGTLGNYLNCQLQGPHHASLGASTAIFGGVGVSASLRMTLDALWRHSRRLHWRVLLPPLGAGLALTALLGTGGERTDVGAHLTGFASGLFFGAMAGLLVVNYGLPNKRTNRMLGATSICCVVYAWVRAFY